VNIKNDFDKTALLYAQEQDHVEIARLLEKAGAKEEKTK